MNSNGRLPQIHGGSSAPSPLQLSVQEIPYEMDNSLTKFELSAEKLSTLIYPQLNSNASVKFRIQTLENSADIQSTHNKTAHESFLNLSGDLKTTENNLRDLVLQVQNSFDLKLATLKKEYDHRFELQSSENKRLQNHVSTLKADTLQLKRKLQATSDRLKKLQQEFGDPEEILEEEPSFAMSITGGGESFSAQNSRPNTTHF